jgi:hypothetical protein
MELELNIPAQEVSSEVVAHNRGKMLAITQAAAKLEHEGNFTPSPYSYEHKFSGRHSEFGCHMYSREMRLTKGALIVGKIHNFPTMNILMTGKIAVMSDSGMRVLEAPQTFMSEPGVQRVGFVLEDCVWVNVFLTHKAGEEHLDEIVNHHAKNPPGLHPAINTQV